jgi:hypothetical protein
LRAVEAQAFSVVLGWRLAKKLSSEKLHNGQKAVFLTFIMLLQRQWAGFLPTEAKPSYFFNKPYEIIRIRSLH